MKRKTRTKLFATAITSLAMAFTLGVGGMVASADDTAAETKVLDFNGTEISTTYSNGTKVNADNISGLFAGKTGEGKCYSLNYEKDTPITFTFASSLIAADYSVISISICNSNWTSGGVTTNVYSVADTAYSNCAGSATTGYGNKTATLTLDVSKLANSEGKIEGFVIIPTWDVEKSSAPMGYFDDVVLTLAEKEEDGTVFEGVLDFDGVAVSTTYSDKTAVNADNIFNLFAGKTGEGKCYSMNFSKDVPITFTLKKSLNAADYDNVIISLCISNWTSGSVTTNVYSVTDTTYANCAGSVTTGYGNKTATLTLDPSKLANSEGKIEGFVVVPTWDVEKSSAPMGYFDDLTFTKKATVEDDYSTKTLLAGDCLGLSNPTNIQDSAVTWSVAIKHGLYEPYGATDSNALLTVNQANFANFETYTGGSYESIRAQKIVFALDVGNLKAENYAQFQMRICFTDWNFGKHQFYIYGSGTTEFTDDTGAPTGYALSFKTSHPQGILKLSLSDIAALADAEGNINYLYIVYWGNVTDKNDTVIGCMNSSQVWVSDLKFIIPEDVAEPVVTADYIEKDIAEMMPVGSGVTFASSGANAEKPFVSAKTKAFDVLNATITPTYTSDWSVYFLLKANSSTALVADGGIVFWFDNTGISIGAAKDGVANLVSVKTDELPAGTYASGQSFSVRMAVLACYLEGVQCGYKVSLYLNGSEEALLTKYFEKAEVTLGQYTNIVLDATKAYSVTLGAVKADVPTAAEIMDVGVYTSSGDTTYSKPRASLALEYFELEGNVVSDLVVVGDATYDKKTKFLTFNSAGTVTVSFTVTNAFGTFQSNELTITYDTGDGGNTQSGGCKSSMESGMLFGLVTVGLGVLAVLKNRRKEN